MTGADFDRQFARLAAHFHLPQDETRETLAVDWLQALQSYPADALEHAVTDLTRTSTERYWPALGRVLEVIKGRSSRYDRAHGKCGTCEGTTWIEAQPWKSNGIIYAGVQRCPDCHVPAPALPERSHTSSLTSIEFHEWSAGRYGRDLMPLAQKARHPEEPGHPHLRALIDAFRQRHLEGTV